jgi:hypothetical protein
MSAPTYTRLSDNEIIGVYNFFKRAIPSFLFSFVKYPADLQYTVSDLDIIDMIIQVDKRCSHYQFFHDGLEINETKKLGVYIYWFLKFKPIHILDERFRSIKSSAEINEYFAVHLLGAILTNLGRDKAFIAGGAKIIEELKYSFRFRTFTAGSMMVLTDFLF